MTCVASATPTDGCYCACCGQPAQAASADWVSQTRRRPIPAAQEPQGAIFRGGGAATLPAGTP